MADLLLICPHCGYRMDQADYVKEGTDGKISLREGYVPNVGALSICLACGSISVFAAHDNGLTLVKPSKDTVEKAMHQGDIIACVIAHYLLVHNWQIDNDGLFVDFMLDKQRERNERKSDPTGVQEDPGGGPSLHQGHEGAVPRSGAGEGRAEAREA